MPVQLAAEQTITVRDKVVVEGPSPSQPFGVVFEDDGETGYLYGLDFSRQDNPIVDALQIYNVQQLSDPHKPSQVQLVWSSDGLKAALLINRYPHAIFDFAARCGYCRTGFPPPMHTGFSKDGHAWDDAAQELFRCPRHHGRYAAAKRTEIRYEPHVASRLTSLGVLPGGREISRRLDCPRRRRLSNGDLVGRDGTAVLVIALSRREDHCDSTGVLDVPSGRDFMG
jgi:hypothetical protein